MAAGQNFSQGLLQGFGLTESILDGAEDRRRRRVLADRQDEDYDYQKGRRGVLDQRQDQQADNRQIQFEQGQEDRTRDIERQGVVNGQKDEQFEQQRRINTEYNANAPHRKKMLDIDARAKELGLDAKEITMRRDKQNEANTQAANDIQSGHRLVELAKQSQDPAERGKYIKQAKAMLEKASESGGLDLDFLSNGGSQKIKTSVQGALEKMKSGQPIDLKDPMLLEVFQQIVKPSLHTSGRSGDFEVDHAQYREGVLYPFMKNKKTGEVVPMTDLFSSEMGDSMSGVGIAEFVEGASALAQIGELAEMTTDSGMEKMSRQFDAAGAMTGRGGRTGMSNDMQLATLKHNQSMERDQIKLDREASEGAWDMKMQKYGDGEDDLETKQAIAFIRDAGYESEAVDLYLPEMRQLMNDYEHINTPQEAFEEIELKKESGNALQRGVESVMKKHPGISDVDAQKITQRIIDMEIYGEKEQEEFVQKFVDRKENKAANKSDAAKRKEKREEDRKLKRERGESSMYTTKAQSAMARDIKGDYPDMDIDKAVRVARKFQYIKDDDERNAKIAEYLADEKQQETDKATKAKSVRKNSMYGDLRGSAGSLLQ